MRNNGWSAEEDALLAEVYPLLGIGSADHFPKRSSAAVKRRASFLEIRFGAYVGRPPAAHKKQYTIPKEMAFGHIPGGSAVSIFHLAQSQA